MRELTQQWIDVVFDEGDYTCMGHKFSNQVYSVTKLGEENNEYVSINAMKKGTTRRIANVTKLRTFLFECDEDPNGNPVDMKTQIKNMQKAGLPWSTITTSASKSIHFIVVLDEPLMDRPIYTAYFQAIQAALAKNGIKIDGACKDPSRFTRAPFGINTKDQLKKLKPTDAERTQKVLKVLKRRSIEEINNWLESQGIDYTDYLKIPTNKNIGNGQVSNATVGHKFDVLAKNFMNGTKYEQGSKNLYQYKMAWLLFGAGCSKSEIETIFSQKFDKIDERDPIGSAERAATKCDPIYISTPEEMKAYYRRQEEEAARELRRMGFSRDLPPEVESEIEEEGPHLYLTIGTEYFKTNPVNGELIPWTKTMFEKIYGSANLPPLNYNLRGYKPDYLSETFPRDLAIDLKTRNMLQRPVWKVKEGDWSTIKGALKHGFGEQYKLILQYCAISIAFPEAKLPAIWFVGPEDKGKSAVIAIFKYLMGKHNTDKISNSILESDFNSFLGEKQLVVVEEAGNWKNPNEVLSRLKDWITETMEVTVNPKYGKQYKTNVHCKFMFSSNDWEGIPVQGAATRFWIREIKEKPKNVVANFYQKIEDEMGHFVHYLINNIVPQLRVAADGTLDTSAGRLYFDPSEYATDAKEFAKSLNRGPVYEGIMDAVSNFFEKFPDEDECYFDLKSLKESLNWTKKGDPTNTQIKVSVKQHFDQDTSKLLERPDSLRWAGRSEGLQPRRKSQWYCLTREFVIDGQLFEMSK